MEIELVHVQWKCFYLPKTNAQNTSPVIAINFIFPQTDSYKYSFYNDDTVWQQI